MKTTVYIATTLDGFIARENGDLDWLPGSDGQTDNEDEDFGFNAFFESVDVMVMGRNTYEFVLATGQWLYKNKRVIVLSKTLNKESDRRPVNVELKSIPPEELYRELLDSGAKHLYIDGGKTIQGFLKAGLINEIIITRIPVLIGKGIPLFGNLMEDIRLRHIETKTYENGFVQSRYAIPEPGTR